MLGKEPNADGLTRSWGTIAKNFRIIQDILDATQGHVPKQAQLVKQFIKWLEDHGVKWNWSDADKSIQHLRSQLRTVFHHSAPPAKAPRAFPQLQILIDKCAAARAREEPEVEVIDVPKPLVKRIRVESDDDNSQLKKPPSKRCKVETKTDEDIDGFFLAPAQQLPAAFSGFRTFRSATFSPCSLVTSSQASLSFSPCSLVTPSQASLSPRTSLVSTSQTSLRFSPCSLVTPAQASLSPNTSLVTVQTPATPTTALVPFSPNTSMVVATPPSSPRLASTSSTTVLLDASQLATLAAHGNSTTAPTPQQFSTKKREEKDAKALRRLSVKTSVPGSGPTTPVEKRSVAGHAKAKRQLP